MWVSEEKCSDEILNLEKKEKKRPSVGISMLSKRTSPQREGLRIKVPSSQFKSRVPPEPAFTGPS